MEDELFNTYSLLLEKTFRQVKRYAKRKFKEMKLGVTVDQWAILKMLNEENQLSQKEISEAIFKDNATLTRIIDLLCKKGLTQRVADANDRRKFRIHLTSNGKKKVEEIYPKIKAIREKAWENLSPEDFGNFKKILLTIYANLE